MMPSCDQVALLIRLLHPVKINSFPNDLSLTGAEPLHHLRAHGLSHSLKEAKNELSKQVGQSKTLNTQFR
jgi:hypothetical protein